MSDILFYFKFWKVIIMEVTIKFISFHKNLVTKFYGAYNNLLKIKWYLVLLP